MFLKEVSYCMLHQGCIYLVKNTVKQQLWNITI